MLKPGWPAFTLAPAMFPTITAPLWDAFQGSHISSLHRIPRVQEGLSLFSFLLLQHPPHPPLSYCCHWFPYYSLGLCEQASVCFCRWAGLFWFQPSPFALSVRGREEEKEGGEEAGPLRAVGSFSALLCDTCCFAFVRSHHQPGNINLQSTVTIRSRS